MNLYHIVFRSIVLIIVIFIILYISKHIFLYKLYSRANNNISQNKLVQEILSYAVENVPFYTEKLNGKDIILSNFPIVSKKYIRERQDSMISRNAVNHRYMESISSANNSWTEKETIKKDINLQEGLYMLYRLIKGDSIAQTTGGSSGEYFYQWFSKDDFWHGLYSFVKGWVKVGWTPSDSIFLYYFHGANCVKLANLFQLPGFYAAVPKIDSEGDITKESFDEFVKILETKKPDLIVSFPSIIFRICQLAYENNYKFIHMPKSMDISADFLFSCQYKFIKSFFPTTDIRLSYGTIEFGQIAQQIPGRMFDYEVYDDIAFIEQGAKSNLIVTSLIYTTQPMIRYEIDDIGHVEYDKLLKKQVIRNLIGKAATININYIDLDAYVEDFNNFFSSDIINIRINAEEKKVYVTTINEEAINHIGDKFIIDGLNYYKIIPILCKKTSCDTIDRFDRKNTPVLKQYSK